MFKDQKGNIYSFGGFCEHPIDGRTYITGHIDHAPHVIGFDKNGNKHFIPMIDAEFIEEEENEDAKEN